MSDHEQGPWVVVVAARLAEGSMWPARVVGPFEDRDAANDECDEQEIANGRNARIYACTEPTPP